MAPPKGKKKQQGYQLPSHILGGPRFSVTPESGLVVTDEMKRILAQPGFIKNDEGGQKLRMLYVDHSIGFTPDELSIFGKACFCGAVEEVQKIFDAGTQPDLGGTETAFQAGYVTIVIWGSQRLKLNESTRHLDVLRLLISRKAPLDLPDICGFTALHHFVTNPHPGSRYTELLRLMLESGANPNVQDRYGVVPLYPAFEHKFIPAIELLMEFGASLDIADADSFTPKMMYVQMGPQVTAAIQKWLRKRAGEEAPRQDKECEGCHKADVPLKNCSRCQISRYCSRECQTKAWPSHKKVCKAFSKSATVTVKPFYQPANATFSPSDLARQATGIIPTASSGSQKALKPLNYPKDIVIKVQTPVAISPRKGDMLVYTKKRDFMCQVRRVDDPKAFDSLESVVKSKGVSGLKAYFSATLNSEDELVVKISEVLAEQPF